MTTRRQLRTLDDISRFENDAPLSERVTARSVFEVIAQTAARHGDRTALTMVMTGADDETPACLTYRELLDRMVRAANLFTALAGARPGVAFMLPALIETHVVLWGAETAGYAVPINFLLQPEHIAELIEAAGARILVALGPHPALDIWQKALQVKQRLPSLTLVQIAPPGTDPGPGAVSFADGLKRQPADLGALSPLGCDDEVVAYFHTGGTTGAPKLVAHTHRNQIVSAFGGAALLDLSENDIITNSLPLFHVGGCIAVSLTGLMSGSNILILSPSGMRNPLMVQRFWKIVERYRATVVGAVPTALGAVLEVPVGAADLSSMRYGIVGAAASPRVLSKKFAACTGGRQLHEIFGMTESAGLTALVPAHAAPVPASVGLRLPYTQISVRKLGPQGEPGEICAPNEIGVLVISGPTVSPGYRSAASNAGVFVDGCLNSGDLAYLDEEGRLYIAGRAKDLIIRSAHNIDPAVIENALAAHPAVALAAAVGEPDRYAGELPVCYVTLRPGASVSQQELKAFSEPRINERPAWPKHIHIVDDIPLTTVGKIFKPALRCDAARRVVTEQLASVLDPAQFKVDVSTGGKRGIQVRVTVREAGAGKLASVKQALEGYLFDFEVEPG